MVFPFQDNILPLNVPVNSVLSTNAWHNTASYGLVPQPEPFDALRIPPSKIEVDFFDSGCHYSVTSRVETQTQNVGLGAFTSSHRFQSLPWFQLLLPVVNSDRVVVIKG